MSAISLFYMDCKDAFSCCSLCVSPVAALRCLNGPRRCRGVISGCFVSAVHGPQRSRGDLLDVEGV